MFQSGRSIRKLLEKGPIKSSAPCRIDSGGTWDIKALALPCEGMMPITVNLALDLRTYVTLLPYRSGWVRISSDNLGVHEAYRFAEVPLDSQFGLFFAIASFYAFHGLEIAIRSCAPVRAGLGGSSAAAVATIKALSVVNSMLGEDKFEEEGVLHLAYHLEDAVNLGGCGVQDQGAAVYGGVNKWVWNYSRQGRPFQRESLLDSDGQRELSRRLLVAYSGKRHLSARINRLWIKQFLGGKTRSQWIAANAIVNRFASRIRERKWKEGAEELRNEVAIRRKITPEAFTPVITRLIEESKRLGCGARFAGAGGGGTVWALGEIDDIQELREVWARILKGTRKGAILDCAVDPEGMKKEG
jgi:D-glycero-alpha-D-manno-heptose-7-phosphate kinase